MRAGLTPAAALLLAAFAAGPAAADSGTGAACCRRDAAEVGGSCCQELAQAATFTKESIYQLDARFTDDSGRPFALGALRGRAVVLDMFFASCGSACPITVTDMTAIQRRLPAGLRSRALFVLVSFDAAHDTPEVLARYRAQRALDGQWVLLHGNDDGIRELAALLGVKYKQDATGAFSHSNILTVLNPEGEIAFQRTGLGGGIGETLAAAVAAAK